MWRAAVACGLASLLATGADASSLTHFTTKEHREVIVLTGEIVEGDADRLIDLIRQVNQSSIEVSGIRLNSTGGSLLEGAKLADAVRTAKIATVIVTKTTCASACFIVFAAGNRKFVGYGAHVGVHGASSSTGQETTDSRAATVAMAKMVNELGVPPAIIGQMVVTPPDQIVWLTTADLESMGVKLVGKPIQTADIAPSTNVATPPSSGVGLAQPLVASLPQDKNARWSAMVASAMNQSALQHGGRADTVRTCQPELKICNSAILFIGDTGKSMMVRAAFDLDDKVVSRDVCTFNAYGDIRECWNWDTSAHTKEMKDSKGQWYGVSD